MSRDAGALEALRRAGVLAVVRAGSAAAAVAAADALVAGGVLGVELTFTTPDAAAAVRAVRERHAPEVLVAAGTLRTPEHARAAADAGADVLVAPHLDAQLLEAMLATGRLALPGVLTPSEAVAALSHGAAAVKLFPAGTVGPAHLRALRGPLPELLAVPTGGIAAEDVGTWLEAGAIAVGAGGELAPRSIVDAGDGEALTARARRWRQALDAHRRA